MPIALPALRERTGDILALARRALARVSPAQGHPLSLDPAAERALLAYRWPGNVRELDNVVQRAAILASGPAIQVVDLHFELTADGECAAPAPAAATAPALHSDLRERERELIVDALRASGGNRKLAARAARHQPAHLALQARAVARRRHRGSAGTLCCLGHASAGGTGMTPVDINQVLAQMRALSAQASNKPLEHGRDASQRLRRGSARARSTA